MNQEQEIELRERLVAIEQSTKSAHHRLDSLENLTESVHTIAVEMKAMREDMAEMKARLSDIEQRPRKHYDTIITAIITAIVGGMIGYFLKR